MKRGIQSDLRVCVSKVVSTYACSIVTTLNYTSIIFFVFVFKCLRSLHHVSRVCRKDCVQIVEIICFASGQFRGDGRTVRTLVFGVYKI